MVEPGAEAARAQLCAALDEAVGRLRQAVSDDPDGVVGADLQRDAERAVGQAARLLSGTASAGSDPGADPHGQPQYSGRDMLARDLLIVVDLARRAVVARDTAPGGHAG